MTVQQKSGLHSVKGQIILLLALGSLCGLIEVVLNGMLRAGNFPWRAGLLTGLGIGILAFLFAIYRKPAMAIGVALIAVMVKQLAIPLLNQSFVCDANSCVAIGLEYSALAAVSLFTLKKIPNNVGLRFITGGTAAFVGSIAFYLIGMHVAPCNYLLSFNSATGFVSYLYRESLSWAVFSAILFPIGWYVGVRYESALARLFDSKPQIAYVAVSALTIICWLISGFAIAGGM